jgi:hypothetical protein
VAELSRVFEVFDREYLIRNDPLLPAEPNLVRDLQSRLRRTGHYTGLESGELDDATRRALADFAGGVNLEGKIRDDDLIYESVVRELRDITPGEG